MKKSIKFLENKKINSKKRENQRNFNYINNYDKIENMKFKEEKNKYIDIIEDFKNSKYLYNLENNLILFQFDNMNIIIRDKIEKSFFFNKFINEYIEEKENNQDLSFKDFIINISNFLIFKDYKYIILDIEKDYINK